MVITVCDIHRLSWRAVICSMLLAAVSASAAAATPLSHEHVALPVDETLTLAAAVDIAYARYPTMAEVLARREQADAWSVRGDSLLAGRPSLMLRYQSDRWGPDNGLNEYEAGVMLPLWSWGGRSAVQMLGESMSIESAAAEQAVRWEVAGLVRSTLWNIALAENDLELAEQALELAERLAASVKRRYELGDVALSDKMHAESFYLEAQTKLIEMRASLLDAERTYRSVTGLERRPQFSAEIISSRQDVVRDHPALVFANAEVSRAEAQVVVVQETAATGTSLLVGARREKPALGDFYDDSIGITLSIPFGGSSSRQTAISAASRVAASARAAQVRGIRALTMALHEAAHRLNVVYENMATAADRMKLVNRHQQMGLSAYEKGEIDLFNLLILQTTALDAQRQVSRLIIDEKRQIALYNQAVGILP
ncbi:MAG: TolC family protein [Gammaproteobacteria bacterium]|nr:TolC family protein [Gammaproteobacteria bacterium]